MCPVDVCICTVPCACVCVCILLDEIEFHLEALLILFSLSLHMREKKKLKCGFAPSGETNVSRKKQTCDATEKENENQSRGSRKMTVEKIAVQSNLKRQRRQAEEERLRSISGNFFLQDHSPSTLNFHTALVCMLERVNLQPKHACPDLHDKTKKCMTER